MYAYFDGMKVISGTPGLKRETTIKGSAFHQVNTMHTILQISGDFYTHTTLAKPVKSTM